MIARARILCGCNFIILVHKVVSKRDEKIERKVTAQNVSKLFHWLRKTVLFWPRIMPQEHIKWWHDVTDIDVDDRMSESTKIFFDFRKKWPCIEKPIVWFINIYLFSVFIYIIFILHLYLHSHSIRIYLFFSQTFVFGRFWEVLRSQKCQKLTDYQTSRNKIFIIKCNFVINKPFSNLSS